MSIALAVIGLVFAVLAVVFVSAVMVVAVALWPDGKDQRRTRGGGGALAHQEMMSRAEDAEWCRTCASYAIREQP